MCVREREIERKKKKERHRKERETEEEKKCEKERKKERKEERKERERERGEGDKEIMKQREREKPRNVLLGGWKTSGRLCNLLTALKSPRSKP